MVKTLTSNGVIDFDHNLYFSTQACMVWTVLLGVFALMHAIAFLRVSRHERNERGASERLTVSAIMVLCVIGVLTYFWLTPSTVPGSVERSPEMQEVAGQVESIRKGARECEQRAQKAKDLAGKYEFELASYREKLNARMKDKGFVSVDAAGSDVQCNAWLSGARSAMAWHDAHIAWAEQLQSASVLAREEAAMLQRRLDAHDAGLSDTPAQASIKWAEQFKNQRLQDPTAHLREDTITNQQVDNWLKTGKR